MGTHISKLENASHTQNLDEAIRQRLKLGLDSHLFAPQKALLIPDNANNFVTWQATYHGAALHIEVLSRLYPELPTSSLTVAVIDHGLITQQALLTDAQPTVAWNGATREQTESPIHRNMKIVGEFVRTGILHIFTGPDHICFILGLLLLGGSLMKLLKIVTAFTIAHSITLSIAVLQIWVPSPRIIEPLIALSIVAVALENLNPRNWRESTSAPRDWRPYIAFGFGLVHGFGFAAVLTEISLPRQMLLPALASFNIGVEIGQATIILIAAPLLALLASRSKLWNQRLVIFGSASIALVGIFWFVQRVTGN